MLQTLIAEDNIDFRQSLKEILTRRFPTMAIDVAEDGEQAVRFGRAHHHDLIFMDIHMPWKNGLEVTRVIKNSDHAAVICLITDFDLLEYREAALACGADHFVVKENMSESLIVSLVESIVHH